MIPSLSYWLVGFRVLSTDAEHAAPLLELCRRRGLPYEDFQNREGGGISLRLRLPAAGTLQRLCAMSGIPLMTEESGGLPGLLRRLLGRPGLVVGGVLGLLLFLSSQSVFWDIRISGNTTVSAAISPGRSTKPLWAIGNMPASMVSAALTAKCVPI